MLKTGNTGNWQITFMRTFSVYEPLKLPAMERSHNAIEEWDEMFLLRIYYSSLQSDVGAHT
jgi:hypothetical protein